MIVDFDNCYINKLYYDYQYITCKITFKKKTKCI